MIRLVEAADSIKEASSDFAKAEIEAKYNYLKEFEPGSWIVVATTTVVDFDRLLGLYNLGLGFYKNSRYRVLIKVWFKAIQARTKL
ncbi:hypothetical protein [Paraburkholderia sp. D1E]|uniref:hypothetical protein n=1 Tax=Paraburkholderia sp. D1E TaxID=3461398 RepID=UPI00404574DF